jgi:hypothetical protein
MKRVIVPNRAVIRIIRGNRIEENLIFYVVKKRFFNNMILIKGVGCLVDLIVPSFKRFLRLGESLDTEENKK